MATSSFTKNFVVSAKKFDQYIGNVQDKTPVTKVKGFTSKLTSLKNINFDKDSKNKQK